MNVLCAINSTLGRRRRRLVVVATVLALVGAVVTAHSAMSHDPMGDAIVMCLAVAETAVVAVGAAVALRSLMPRPLRRMRTPAPPGLALVPSSAGVRARAGPPRLQVFRL